MMSLPIGTVISYLGLADSLNNLERKGWLVCDGRSLATTDYQALNQVIGETYGSAGAGYFNLPQLSGMFLRGIDLTGKYDPDTKSRTSPDPSKTTEAGAVVGSRQLHEVLNHGHNFSAFNWNNPAQGYSGGGYGFGNSATTDGYGGKETRPSNIYAYYLIFAGD